MTEEDPRDELIRALFDGARRERPSPALRERVLAGTGVSAPVRALRPGNRRHLFGLLALAAAAGLTVFIAVPSRKEPMISLSAEPPSKQSEPVAAPSSEPRGVPEPEKVVSTTKKGVPRAPASAVMPSARPAELRDAPPPSLSAEIAVLDRARVALASDPAKALGIVDEYERELHGTRLVAEASLLRIEALARSGRQAAASDLANHFIETNPGSALAERARAFVTASPSGAARVGADAGAGTR